MVDREICKTPTSERMKKLPNERGQGIDVDK